MADRRERLIFEATSNLGIIITDLQKIVDLQKQQLTTSQYASNIIEGTINDQKRALLELIATQQNLRTETARTASEYANQQASLRSESSRTSQQITNQANSIKGVNSEVQALKSNLSGLASLAVSAFAFNRAKDFVNDIIDAKSKVDTFKATLMSLGNSVQVVDNVSNAISELDKRSSFTSEQLLKTATTLTANSIPAKNLVEDLTMLGTVSAMVGEQKLPLIAKAYLDVKNKQVLMAQEVRQFIENGVPLYDLLAKSMDKPKQAVIEMAKEHEISFAMVDKALRESTEKGGVYYGALENRAKQLKGEVANISAEYFYGEKRLGDYFEGTIKSGIEVLKDLIKYTIGSESAIARTMSTVKAGIAIWLSYKTAQIAVNASMQANNAESLIELSRKGQNLTMTQLMTTSINGENAVRLQRIAILREQIIADTYLTAEIKAQQLARLASIESQVVDNSVKVVGTGITTSLTGAVRGLNVAIQANPFGFALSALTLLIGGYYAYKSSVTEVAEVQNEEINSLNKLKVGYELQLRAIANTKIGTEERKNEVLKMQALYPEYIGNINLETASQSQLSQQLRNVNVQIERKIKLATANAQVELLTKEAIEIENKRADVIRRLRDENLALSEKYIRDANFIVALRSEQAIKEIDNVNTYQKNMNSVALGVYDVLGQESKKAFADIEKASLKASLAQKADAQATYHDTLEMLKGQLANAIITRKEYDKLAKEADAKRRGEEIKEEEEKEFTITKNKKHARALSAKEIEAIETGQLYDSLENEKKKLKASYELDVDNVNKKYANQKNGAEKATKEITALAQKYQQDVKKIDDEIEKNKKLSATAIKIIELNAKEQSITTMKELLKAELDLDKANIVKKYANQKDGKVKAEAELLALTKQYYANLAILEEFDANSKSRNLTRQEVEANESFKELAKIEGKYNENKVKEDKKTKTELEKLSETYEEAKKKREDAQRLYDAVSNATTATEKYKVTLKYGKQTNDEITALNVARWKQEVKNLEAYMNTLDKNGEEYIKLNEDLLKKRTAIANAETSIIIANANEQIALYGKTFKAYVAYLTEMSSMTSSVVSNIAKIYSDLATSQINSLKKSYDTQYQMLGTNYADKLKLTDDYAKKEIEILTSQSRTQLQLTYLKTITEQLGNQLSVQLKLWEEHETKKAKLIKDGASLASENATYAMQSIAGLSVGIINTISSVKQAEYQSSLSILDSQQDANKRHYEDVVNLAKDARDKKIAIIKEEEQAQLDTIAKQLDYELQKISILAGASVSSQDKTSKELLAGLERQKIREQNALEQANQKEKELLDASLAQEKAVYDEKVKITEDALAKQLFALEAKYQNDYIEAWGDKQRQAELLTKYYADVKTAQDKSEADKAVLLKEYNDKALIAQKAFEDAKGKIASDAEAQRLVKIEEARQKDISSEKAKYDESVAMIKRQGDDELDIAGHNFMQKEAQIIESYNQAMALATGNVAKQTELTDSFNKDILEAQAITDSIKLSIQEKTNKKIEDETIKLNDNLFDIDEKYKAWKLSKDKQYQDEQQKIIDDATQKKADIEARANQDKIIAEAKTAQAKESIITTSRILSLRAEEEYQLAVFKADKEFTDQSLRNQQERINLEAKNKMAQINSSLWVGAAGLVAINPMLGLAGAFSALIGGSSIEAEIDKQRASAWSAIQSQIDVNNARTPPKVNSITQASKVVYIRTPQDEILSNGYDMGTYDKYELLPDFFKNPHLADGHEQPIDYTDIKGRRLGIYAWEPFEQDGTLYYQPRLYPSYFQGSNFVDIENRFPSGRDTVPAMVNKGERIIPTDMNIALGGANVTNKELVNQAIVGKYFIEKMPSFVEKLSSNRIAGYTLNYDGMKVSEKDNSIVEELRKLSETIVGNTQQTSINIDAYGVTVQEKYRNSLINYKNQQYKRRQN